MMPNRDPRDGHFCPYRTTMINRVLLAYHLFIYLHFSCDKMHTERWFCHKGPFTQRASDDPVMHAFLDAMKRRDRVFTLHAIKMLFPHCQIYTCICVVKLETCPMRAITGAMDLARVDCCIARSLALCVKRP